MKKTQRHNSIDLSQLKPTQVTVGMLEVEHKRRRLQSLVRRPGELIAFILEHPIRVVMGPAGKFYVVDHHHLALALIRENFETAPMDIDGDFSKLSGENFWKKMQAMKFVHLCDEQGRACKVTRIPKDLEDLVDDPYRSLAGFAREAGAYEKVPTPFAEFLWADFFRARIHHHVVKKSFEKALKHAIKLARTPEAKKLPGYKRTRK